MMAFNLNTSALRGFFLIHVNWLVNFAIAFFLLVSLIDVRAVYLPLLGTALIRNPRNSVLFRLRLVIPDLDSLTSNLNRSDSHCFEASYTLLASL